MRLNRKTNIDLLRVVSAAAVVILHSVAAPLGNGNTSIPFLTGKILTVIHALTLRLFLCSLSSPAIAFF